MHRNPIPARRKPQAPTLGLITIAVGAVVTLGALTGWATKPEEPTVADPLRRGTVNATDGDPAVFYPESKPQVATLALRLPVLSIEQQQYQRMAEVLPRLPIAYGITDPPIGFSDNQAAVFTALIYTESSFSPYNTDGTPLTSSAGCQGLAQLCGDLLTHEAIFSPARNLYIAAAYFKRLIDEEDGDILAAVRTYKGISTPDMHHLASRVWDYLLIENVR